MLSPVRIPCRRKERFTAVHLAREVGPPFASVLVQIHASRPLLAGERFEVTIDGRTLCDSGFERVQVAERAVQIIVHGDSFSWLQTTRSLARLRIVLDGRALFETDIEVAPYQG